MKDYRVTVKVRNNRILKAIEDAGGSPGQKWCDANGLGYARINDFINMTCSPLNSEGGLYQDASKLCDVLNKLPEDLWSNEQLYPLEKNFSEMEMDYSQVMALLPSDEQSYLPDFSDFEDRQTKNLIGTALATLTPREQNVLRLRYDDGLTHSDIGERLGVSTKRARQIEVKALRKMRSPKMVGLFVDCLDVGVISESNRVKYKLAAGEN